MRFQIIPPRLIGEGRGEVSAKKCSHCEPFSAVLTSEAVFLLIPLASQERAGVLTLPDKLAIIAI